MRIKIEMLQDKDLNELVNTFHFPWTSLEATNAKWHTYLSEQKTGNRVVCLAKWQDRLVGYGSLVKNSKYPNFRACQIPEIHDVWISDSHRGQGFGRQLISHLEWLAQKANYREIGIGVGLYKDYGRAQRLYIQLGYVPDGEGITYQYNSTVPGNSYSLDDDLVIWLKKKLPSFSTQKDSFYLERQ